MTRTSSLTDLPEVRFGFAEGALLVAATVCSRLDVGVQWGLVLLGAITAVACVVLPLRFSVGVAVSAWAFLTGFVVHVGGQLTFGATDLERMGFLVLVALLAAVAAAAVPREGRDRPGPTYDEAPAARMRAGVR